MSLSGIGILLSLFCAFAIIIWIAIIIFSKDEEEEVDAPVGINFMADQSDGRAIGVEKYVEAGKDGRRIVTLSARDVRINKNLKLIPDVKVIVDKNKTIVFPKGSWSRDKNINWYIPPTADKFPEPLKKTEFGKMLMFYTALKDADNAEIDAFKAGMQRQAGHIRSMGAGEISTEKINLLDEYFMEALDAIKDTRKKDEGGAGFAPPRFGGQMGGGNP